MSVLCMFLSSWLSVCQKLSNLVEIWRNSDKNKLDHFLVHPIGVIMMKTLMLGHKKRGTSNFAMDFVATISTCWDSWKPETIPWHPCSTVHIQNVDGSQWLLSFPNLESELGATFPPPQFWAEVPPNFWLKFSPLFWDSFPSRKQVLLRV